MANKPDLTVLGILGFAAAGLLAYEIFWSQKAAASPEATPPPPPGTAPGAPSTTPTTPTSPVPPSMPAPEVPDRAFEENQRSLVPLRYDVVTGIVGGDSRFLTSNERGGPITAVAELELRAHPEGTPIPFEVSISFYTTIEEPPVRVVVEPGTSRRVRVERDHPALGNTRVEVFVKPLSSSGSLDLTSFVPKLSVFQNGQLVNVFTAPYGKTFAQLAEEGAQ